MNTLHRINVLLAAVNCPPIVPLIISRTGVLDEDNNFKIKSSTPAHDIVDVIDKHCGIITRFRPGGELALLGERLTRLERHIDMTRAPKYFWLGADAENLAATG